MEDHFSINVAQCVRAQGEQREYQHYVRVLLPTTRTRVEAREIFDRFVKLFPEPEWAVSLTEHHHRAKELRHSPPRPSKVRSGIAVG